MASWGLSTDVEGREQVFPHPKPEKRHKASQNAWSGLHEKFAHECCVNCGLPHESLHHVVPRSQGGDDIYENLAPLCGDGTRGCHGLLESHGPGWERVAAAVRQYVILDRDRCVYVIGQIGWDRFDSRYPMLSEPGGADGETRTQMSSGRPGSESDWDKYEEPVWRYRPPEEDPASPFEEELSW